MVRCEYRREEVDDEPQSDCAFDPLDSLGLRCTENRSDLPV